MTSSAQEGADAGAHTDQHVTGSEETGDFITDKAPAADTPAHGSGNAGVDTAGANRDQGRDAAPERD